MQIPIVREFRDDILNKNPENQVRQEPFKLETESGPEGRIIVPRHSPFFIKTLKLYFKNGQEMTDEHFEIWRIMPGLTNLAAQGVACFIHLKDPKITEGLLDYDVVGEFTLFDTSMMNLVIGSVEDDRPIDFYNLKDRPIVYPPKLHPHSLLYDVVAFEDTIHLLDSLSDFSNGLGTPIIQIKIERYFDTFNHYLKVYKEELQRFLADHAETYNSHGINASQVNLGNVDNFATARSVQELMSGRDDLHLTVQGLKTILELTSFDSSEFLEKGTLPVSQFGNTNFIPPSIDGSFEGLGGMFETAGISMESDGSIVFLENRFDGRVNGLYYSVIQEPYVNPRRVYTGYRYVHQRLEADGASANLIAQGSGDEVIMVCDSSKELFYIGLTNGSLDPASHVYSPINLDALKPPIGPTTKLSSWVGYMNIALIGDWIYIFFCHSYANGVMFDPAVAGSLYRYVYRVPKASVAAQIPVTAVSANISFKDGDGKQWNNVSRWQWCTPVPTPGGSGGPGGYDKWYFKYVDPKNLNIAPAYRSQVTYTCPVPDKPGYHLVRFAASWWGRYTVVGFMSTFLVLLEMTYEFNPSTGVMTLLHQTPTWELDFYNLPSSKPNSAALSNLVSLDSFQGSTVLEDGTIVASTGQYQSFPRGRVMTKPEESTSKYETMRRQWNTDSSPWWTPPGIIETVVSPLRSSVKPRSFLLGNGGDIYTATDPETLTFNRLYYRAGPGKLAKRASVTNLFYPEMISRPLSNDVKEIRGNPVMGGATVTVPAAQLDSFGTLLGECSFCMNTQKTHIDMSRFPLWPQPVGDQDILLISGFTQQPLSPGMVDLVATSTITYPGNVVDLLKREVDDVPGVLASPKVYVTVCDPTGPLTDKFGWLPVLVMINWAKVGTVDRRVTFLSITPTYSGGANKVVTGYTVLDKVHRTLAGTAVGVTASSWGAILAGNGPNSTHGAMRVGYHVNGNAITGFFDSGVQATGPGDALSTFALFSYANKTTRRWTTATPNITGQTGGGNHKCVIPDDGVVTAIAHSTSTGGAGTMFAGPTKVALLGSVYPEVGWSVFFQSEIKAVFNGKAYLFPPGVIDLRDLVDNPSNKTFYIYAVLATGTPEYQITVEKRLETPFQVWVGKVVTGTNQILTVERFNVFTINGNRISELKRGNSIPASSGLVNVEGQIPWLRSNEMLP